MVIEMSTDIREFIKDKKRIVIKIGSSSLQHKESGDLDYTKMEVLVRELCNLRNQGKDVILVTSGAIAVGKKAIGLNKLEQEAGHLGVKQACAAVGQARLMMIYQKIFAEYNQVAAQILMTKDTIVNNFNRQNAKNTFTELLNMGVIPIVNENDTVATYEIVIGDNDTLSAIVTGLTRADLLILLSDIDGLYTDDPRTNPEAEFIEVVEKVTPEHMQMGKKSTGSNVGTGGMNTKMVAAHIATNVGADMIIANSSDIRIIHRLMDGRKIGTLFKAQNNPEFNMVEYVKNLHH
ncbi:MAG: glutamate 5-kinase [Lachnospiraceae bacterium]|nr:glutamate 5-kinase [Lachnospiraceae bacterium]